MRMQLTPDEVRVVQRMREIEDAHRGGWNKALVALDNKLTKDTYTTAEIFALTAGLKKHD